MEIGKVGVLGLLVQVIVKSQDPEVVMDLKMEENLVLGPAGKIHHVEAPVAWVSCLF